MTRNIVSILYEHTEKHPEKTAIIQGRTSIVNRVKAIFDCHPELVSGSVSCTNTVRGILKQVQNDKFLKFANSLLSYGELSEKVLGMAACFRERGIGPEDKVLIFVPMSADLYAILLALWHIGATAVFIDPWLMKKRLKYASSLIKCKAFIAVPKAHVMRLFSSEIRGIPIKFYHGWSSYSCKCQANDNDFHKVNPDSIALITLTTGSTGKPKAAKRTHEFLMAQQEVLAKHLKPQVDDIDLVTLPIFVLSNLASGITTYITEIDLSKPENTNTSKLFEDIDHNEITTTSGSPVIFDKLADYILENSKSLSSLRTINIGGAPVFPQLAKKLIKAFPKTNIQIVYGSTEAEPISTISAKDLVEYDNPDLQSGLLVGLPVEDISVRILPIIEGPIIIQDQKEFEGLALNQGEIGETCVSGEHVLKEYYNNEEAQIQNKIAVENTIWHRTGDAGYLDENNQLFLMGRTKFSFKHNGETFYLFPLEEALNNLPEVKIGTYIKSGKSLILAVELIDNSTKENHIIDFVQKLNLPIPYKIKIMKIPRDPRHNSKIDYEKLKTNLD